VWEILTGVRKQAWTVRYQPTGCGRVRELSGNGGPGTVRQCPPRSTGLGGGSLGAADARQQRSI